MGRLGRSNPVIGIDQEEFWGRRRFDTFGAAVDNPCGKLTTSTNVSHSLYKTALPEKLGAIQQGHWTLQLLDRVP
jgi:hypothetical protein